MGWIGPAGPRAHRRGPLLRGARLFGGHRARAGDAGRRFLRRMGGRVGRGQEHGPDLVPGPGGAGRDQGGGPGDPGLRRSLRHPPPRGPGGYLRRRSPAGPGGPRPGGLPLPGPGPGSHGPLRLPAVPARSGAGPSAAPHRGTDAGPLGQRRPVRPGPRRRTPPPTPRPSARTPAAWSWPAGTGSRSRTQPAWPGRSPPWWGSRRRAPVHRWRREPADEGHPQLRVHRDGVPLHPAGRDLRVGPGDPAQPALRPRGRVGDVPQVLRHLPGRRRAGSRHHAQRAPLHGHLPRRGRAAVGGHRGSGDPPGPDPPPRQPDRQPARPDPGGRGDGHDRRAVPGPAPVRLRPGRTHGGLPAEHDADRHVRPLLGGGRPHHQGLDHPRRTVQLGGRALPGPPGQHLAPPLPAAPPGHLGPDPERQHRRGGGPAGPQPGHHPHRHGRGGQDLRRLPEVGGRRRPPRAGPRASGLLRPHVRRRERARGPGRRPGPAVVPATQQDGCPVHGRPRLPGRRDPRPDPGQAGPG